jgi:hypothetical protein
MSRPVKKVAPRKKVYPAVAESVQAHIDRQLRRECIDLVIKLHPTATAVGVIDYAGKIYDFIKGGLTRIDIDAMKVNPNHVETKDAQHQFAFPDSHVL